MLAKDIPLPDAWPSLVRKAVVHAVALARWTMICVHSEINDEDAWNVRFASEIQQRDDEIAMLREQMRINRTRMDKIPPKNRPHFAPCERLAILKLRAARGWANKQTADAFAVTEETITNWMHELDVHGPESLVQTATPINKYPDFVIYVCQELKSVVTCLGSKKIAEYCARAGLHLSATTIGRRLKSAPAKPIDPDPPSEDSAESSRRTKSCRPNHTWLVDLTAVPVGQGFWCSWFPNALPQVWPFCWHVALIIDHFSRRLIGFALFRRPPKSVEVTDALDRAIQRTGHTPKYIISDKGPQFFPARANPENRGRHHYAQWSKARGIKPRFGAVGKYGSIAIIERAIRTLKDACTRRILVPIGFDAMREELGVFITWYNTHRPHATLSGRTPQEVYDEVPAPPPLAIVPNSKAPPLEMEISFLEDRPHLPVIEMKRAA